MSRDLINELDRSMPAAKRASLGTLLAAIQADVAALAATERLLASPGLVIKAGSSPTVKAGSGFSALAAGVVVTKAADTDMAAIAGTLASTKFALWAFYVDSAGTLTSSTKTADVDDADAALRLKPAVPAGKVELGYIIVENGTGGAFTAGTTNLDATDVTTTYVSNEPLTPASAAAGLALSA